MMLAMYSPVSLEAQKLISVSIGKINASRVTRTGTSLHKSLLVASVLQKARNVYLDEERERALHYPQCPPSPPELTVTPVCSMNNPPPPPPEPTQNIGEDNHSSPDGHDNKENRLSCHEDEVAIPDRVGEESRLPLAEANTGNNVTHTTTTTTTVTSITNTSTITTTSSSQSSRKRRRVSDQETAAAISSILPKRLRSELKEEYLNHEKVIIVTSDSPVLNSEDDHSFSDECAPNEHEESVVPDAASRLSDPEMEPSNESTEIPTDVTDSTEQKSTDEEQLTESADSSLLNNSDSSVSSQDDSDSDGDDSASDTSASSGDDEMEVDQLTSLVSYFSFSKSQNQPEFCIGPIHSPSGPHGLALTA